MTESDLAFNYEKLRYIKTRGPDDKRPLEKWGGYGQDFDAVDTVYTHAEVEESDHDHWAVVDFEDRPHGSLATLVFDLDIHKAPDDFDPDKVSVPADTAVVKSQNGGLHVYFVVYAQRGEYNESDFAMTEDLGWDIDIRGSAVSAHVVAPTDIPGVETPYELVQDHSINHVFDPADAAERIRYNDEPLLEFKPGGRGGSFDIDRDVEPPAEMPTCYHRGLQLRQASPDDPNLNTHKVNVLTALCGLAAGYDIETMVGHFCEEYPPDNPDPDQTAYQLQHIAEKMDRGEYSPPSLNTLRDYGLLDESESCACDIPYHGRKSVKAIELDYSEIGRGEALLDSMTSPTDPAGELEHRNGGYGYTFVVRNEDGEVVDTKFTAVTNFTVETVSYIDTYEGDLLNLRVHPAHPMEDSYEIQIHPKVFNDPSSFTEEIVRGRTTLFEPQSAPKYVSTQQILNELRLTVAGQQAPDHVGTEYIGLHGKAYDEWVTPAGTLTAEGWATDPRYVYYEKGGDTDMASSLEEKWQLDPDDGVEYDTAEVAAICELLPWTRQPERGLPVLGWFYAAPLKPLITQAFGEGEFNLLQVVGGTGTGKTSTLEVYYPLFGADPAPFGCGDKGFTIEKKLASSCGLPIWLDEYKPSDLAEGKLQWLHRRLRGVTRGQSYSKGLPSLGEVTFQMRAPVVFSGEQTIEEAAVRRRTIITQFSTGSTTGEFQRAYCELTGASHDTDEGTEQFVGKDLYDHARAYYQYILSHSPTDIRELWIEAGERREDLADRYGFGSLEASEKQGLRTIIFGFAVYKQFAQSMGADEAALPGEKELVAALQHVAHNIGPDGRRKEHIDEFTELVAQAALEGYLAEGEHYTLVDSRKYDTKVLAFHMPSTFSAVKRYVRDFNIESEYSILGKNDYIDNYRDKAKQADSYPLAVNQRVTGLSNGHKAVYIDPERAADTLGDGFSLRAFGYYDDEEDEEADGSPTDPLTPLSAINAERGYVTVTVEVAALETDTPDAAPPLTGVVTDATAAVDILDWFGGVFEDQLEEEGTYRINNARAGEYDGTPQLELVKGVTEVEDVQAGVGHLDSADSGQNESLDAAADGGETHEDYEDIQGKITQVFRNTTEEELTMGEIAGKLEDSPKKVKDGLEQMATTGRLLKEGDTYSLL